MNEILGPYEISLTALQLTFDVEHDVLAAALADPVGGLAHVGAGLRLGDALQHEAEVGEDHAALGRVGQLHALHTEQLFVETSILGSRASHKGYVKLREVLQSRRSLLVLSHLRHYIN